MFEVNGLQSEESTLKATYAVTHWVMGENFNVSIIDFYL